VSNPIPSNYPRPQVALAALAWMLILATPSVAAAGPEDHLIELVFEVRDDEEQRLREPWIRLSDDKIEPFQLLDDGLEHDIGADDHLWTAGITLMGSPKTTVTVFDRQTGDTVGSRTLFLPVAKQVRIILFVADGDPGLLLLSEKAQQADATAETAGGLTRKTSESSDSVGNRFVYLLWVLLLLGLLGLGYLRVVLRRFLADFMPTWRKLGRFLADELPEEQTEDDG